jgi:hypothetical protein
MIGRLAAGAIAAAALAACATQAPPPAADPAPIPEHGTTSGHTCDGTRIQQFVGQQRSPALEQQMLEASGAATVRWVPPGMAVTMEFRADRLTVFLDANSRIERLSCS